MPIHTGHGIYFLDVLHKLEELGYKIGNSIILYFSHHSKCFVHWGTSGSTEQSYLGLEEFKDRLILKMRSIVEEPQQNREPRLGPIPAHPEEKKESSHRNKERRIESIIEKVSEWRKLYTGTLDASGHITKLSLEEAAKKVGIAKKTLDDYLLQLRAGKKFGFDFNAHKEEKVGILRAFVKQQKREGREGRKVSPTEEMGGEVSCVIK